MAWDSSPAGGLLAPHQQLLLPQAHLDRALRVVGGDLLQHLAADAWLVINRKRKTLARALHSGLLYGICFWVGAPTQGRCPALAVEDGPYSEKTEHRSTHSSWGNDGPCSEQPSRFTARQCRGSLIR